MYLSLCLRLITLLFLEVLSPILTKQIVPLTHGGVTPAAQHVTQSDLWLNRQSVNHPACQMTSSVPPIFVPTAMSWSLT